MIDWLFDAHSFITRNHCGKWDNWLILLNQLANFLIFIAYFSIPISLYGLWREVERRPTLKEALANNTYVVLQFIVFILACGLGHLMNVISFTSAPYRFFTLVDCITALASVPTAVVLPGIIRTILYAEDKDKGGR